jgi:hypothetical protein
MTRTVIARDVHCVFPGCRKKAAHGDLDHIKAFEPGDLTTQANLMSLCRRHHRLKHDGKWTVERDDKTGVTTWADRRGRRYQTRPPTRPTTTTAPINPVNAPPAAEPPADTSHNDEPPPPF